MRVKETTYTGEIPVFQIDDATRSVQGGFTLDKTGIPEGYVLKRGAVIEFDESTRSAKFIVTARLVEAAADDAVDYKIAKGSAYAVGAKFGGETISAIDKSNEDYDAVTVGATLGVDLSIGDVVPAVEVGDFVGLNYHETEVHSGDVSLTLLISGTVYERRTDGIGSELGAKMPRIIRSQSF